MPLPGPSPRARRSSKGLLLAAVLAVLAVLAAPTALAGAAQGDTGFLRLAHLSPDTPSVDVYVQPVTDPAGTVVVPGVSYGAVSEYRVVPTGAYVVSMRAAGAPAESPPVISATLTVEPGAAYTVAGLGRYDALGLRVLDDRLDLPPQGQANVRVINASATTPALDLLVDGGPALVQGLAFAEPTGYQAVPAGGWTLRAGPTGAAGSTLPVELAPNGVYTVLVVDGPTGLETQLAVDAQGSGEVPTGGIETGLGGAVPAVPAPDVPGAGLVAAGLGTAGVAAAGLLVALRGRTSAHSAHSAHRRSA